jgi:hypothetical protein
MKPILTILLCLWSLVGLAQFHDPAAVAGFTVKSGVMISQAPTNQPGNLAWFYADVLSPGVITTWPDLTTNTAHNITDASNGPTVEASKIDGHNSANFYPTIRRLTSSTFTNSQPYQVFTVVCLTNVATVGSTLWSLLEETSGKSVFTYQAENKRFVVDCGVWASFSKAITTNVFMLLEFVANGSSSYVKTNNVQCGNTVNVGTLAIDRIRLGTSGGNDDPPNYSMAEWSLFSPPISDTASVVHYFKTNYPSLNLP